MRTRSLSRRRLAERVYGALAGGDGRLAQDRAGGGLAKAGSRPSLNGDYALRAWAYGLKGNVRRQSARDERSAEEGLKRFPDSASLKLGLAWSYLLESDEFGCRSRTVARRSRSPTRLGARGRGGQEQITVLRSTTPDFSMAQASMAWHGETLRPGNRRARKRRSRRIPTTPSDRAQLCLLSRQRRPVRQGAGLGLVGGCARLSGLISG